VIRNKKAAPIRNKLLNIPLLIETSFSKSKVFTLKFISEKLNIIPPKPTAIIKYEKTLRGMLGLEIYEMFFFVSSARIKNSRQTSFNPESGNLSDILFSSILTESIIFPVQV
jgi:hypothetical protein